MMLKTALNAIQSVIQYNPLPIDDMISSRLLKQNCKQLELSLFSTVFTTDLQRILLEPCFGKMARYAFPIINDSVQTITKQWLHILHFYQTTDSIMIQNDLMACIDLTHSHTMAPFDAPRKQAF